MKVGTRRSMVTGGALFGSAFGLTALGVSMHSLPLMYAGNCKLFPIQLWTIKLKCDPNQIFSNPVLTPKKLNFLTPIDLTKFFGFKRRLN